jgi:hypothetical protein
MPAEKRPIFAGELFERIYGKPHVPISSDKELGLSASLRK